MLAKINKLKSWQAALIIVLIGIAVFFTGLTNPFQGDDTSQIVNNVSVHSITNIRQFFTGGTFYVGPGLPLSGGNYRPLMTTVFSLLYTLVGPHTLGYHLLQLVLYIGCAILLFLFLKYTFKPLLALVLALIFLVHPVNSQVVFAIPSMQDVLCLFFGLLALWLLVRFKSVKSLLLVALCLLLCLLSKETGILFLAMALAYLFLFNRERLYKFSGIVAVPTVLWLVLKIHASGLSANPRNAPIDSLSLAGRLLNDPAIVLFYITKLLFPWKLASGYYWTYPNFTIRHTLLPLLIDLLVVGLLVGAGFLVRKKVSRSNFITYQFFAIWSCLGILLVLQISPLDMTVSETWLYFPLVGVLGMIGIVLIAYQKYIRPGLFISIAAIIIVGFGIRSAVRGTDYKSAYVLATHDITASADDYTAYNDIAAAYIKQNNFSAALPFAEKSVGIYPTTINYLDEGISLAGINNYSQAMVALKRSLNYFNYSVVYETMAQLTLVYGTPSADQQLLVNSVNNFPKDSVLWMYLAILEDRYYTNSNAQKCITYAAGYGQVPSFVYDNIMRDKPFTIYFNGKTINIP